MSEENQPGNVKWSGITDVGKVRKNNEDSFLGLTFNDNGVHYLGKHGEMSLEKEDFVFAVSDGMGGANAGEFASKTAVEKITALLPPHFDAERRNEHVDYSDLLQEIFDQTHQRMCYLGKSYEECAGMGSTLSLCWLAPKYLYFAHIGDSRIYHLPVEGEMKQLTKDDTHVGFLQRTGQINEREARNHPRKNALQRALGGGHQFVTTQTGSVVYERGDLFLLCSDGVIDGLWDRQLYQLLKNPDEKEASLGSAERLVQAALDRSGQDNTTALVIECL